MDYKTLYEQSQKENEELKKDHCMQLHYWRCFVSYVDPKCDLMPDKEHIDDWCKCGDHVDEKLKEYLYDKFHIDEDEDEE